MASSDLSPKSFFKSPIAVAAVVVAAAYLSACAWLYFRQDSLIFHPRPDWKATPREAGLEYEQVSFEAADGTALSGWFTPASPERGVILFCHGNSNNISYELGPLKVFHDLGFSMLLFDYRGYGHSDGHPSEKGMAMDAEAALDYLVKTRGIPMNRIVIQGRSLGGGVAIPLAVRHTPRALLVDSSFTSLVDMAAKLHPQFPVELFLRHRFNSIAEIPKLKCPVLVTHSSQDELIPFEQGKRLYAAAPEPKTFLEITGPHDNSGVPASQATYRRGVEAFLKKVFP